MPLTTNVSNHVGRAGCRALAATLASLVPWLGCVGDPGEGNDDSSNEPCVPGQSIACDCDDGSPGAQVCEPDGVGFDECRCEGADDDSDSDASASGNDGPSDDSADNGSDPTDSTEPTDPTDPTTADDDGSDSSSEVPDFQNDIVTIFAVSCGSPSNLCHARNAYFPAADQGCCGWLSLENEPLGSFFDDLDPTTQMPSEGPVPGCEDKTLYERLIMLAPWECGADSRYIVPGSLEQSYIWLKLTDGTLCGDFRVMPPPEEGFEITAEQVDTLEAWILAGAPE